MYYIGIDLGTSSIKALLVNNKGQIINESKRSYPLYLTENNWSEQNPNDWYLKSLEVIKEVAIGNEDKINAISFSGQMHGMVILDENDQVIRPAILWNDQRTTKEVDYLNNVIGIEKLLKLTGNIAVTGFTAPKVLWLYENERENFNKINKLMLPKDYLIYKLSGVFATDYSDASGTLYFDVENKKYVKEMLEILKINESQLPKLYESYQIVGELTEETKQVCNLVGNIKVTPGGGDQSMGAIGTGVVRDGEINISLGTSGVVFAATNNYFVDNNSYMHSFAHATSKYHIMGVTLSAAGSLQWWKENFYTNDSYDDIFNDIEKTNIEDTLYYLPYLTGERAPINDPNAKGVFVGIKATHKKAHFSRALLEGVSFSTKQCFDIIESLGVKSDIIKITGGGAKNLPWVQMMADILNKPVEMVEVEEGPAYGAAIIAMVGVGEFASVEEACNNVIKTKQIIKPSSKNAVLYNNKYQKYNDLYPRLKTFF